jgi:hypothetical protein
MWNNNSTEEQFANRLSDIEVLGICRNHIESLQNLRYMISLDAYDPTQVKLNLRMMEWHLHNLSEALFSPHERAAAAERHTRDMPLKTMSQHPLDNAPGSE